MTKTEKVKAARSVRAHIQAFTSAVSSPYVRKMLSEQMALNPDDFAFAQLLKAGKELAALIDSLTDDLSSRELFRPPVR